MRDFKEIICEILEVDEINYEQMLDSFECWDSLTQLSIIAMMFTYFNINLKYNDLEGKTVGDLKRMI